MSKSKFAESSDRYGVETAKAWKNRGQSQVSPFSVGIGL